MNVSRQGFNGLRVLALESRRAAEITKLIEAVGGRATVVPAMRELPLDSNHEAISFAEHLIAGQFDAVLFLTGSGTRLLFEAAQSRFSREELVAAMKRTKMIARGPKPVSALRELGLIPNIVAPEPSTWREVLTALDVGFGKEQKGLRLAIQEYGAENCALITGLEERGVRITRVPIYRWALPEDLTSLRATVESLMRGEFDVVLFLTGTQAAHLCEVAGQMGKQAPLVAGLKRAVIASIGPDTTAELLRLGIRADFVPSHPRMGILVNEIAGAAAEILNAKRGSGGF